MGICSGRLSFGICRAIIAVERLGNLSFSFFSRLCLQAGEEAVPATMLALPFGYYAPAFAMGAKSARQSCLGREREWRMSRRMRRYKIWAGIWGEYE